MKKLFIGISTMLVVGLGSTHYSGFVHAEVKSQPEISNERSLLTKDLSKAEAEVSEVLIDLQEIDNEIKDIDNTLRANQKARVEIVEEITKTEKEVLALESEINVLEENIEARFEILKKRASSYQKSGGDIGYIDVLIGAKDFSDLISRLSAVSKIKSSDAELINQQESDKKSLEKQRQTVEDKLSDLKETKRELESIEKLVTEQKTTIENKKRELKNKQKELNEVKSKLEYKDEHLAILEENVQGIFNTSVSDTNESITESSHKGNGKLSWPTSGGYISSHLGQRNGKMHKGIDIARTDRSTSPPIFAADGGVIESTGPSGGYGNKIVIDHGNGMKTIYAHLSSISVSSGQSISKGDKLGIMGTTGNSTGIHLHFEVYVDGVLQNPTKYFN